MRFDNTIYTVDEDVGIIQPLLVLSNPSSFVETVEVISTDIEADGIMLYVTYINILLHISICDQT